MIKEIGQKFLLRLFMNIHDLFQYIYIYYNIHIIYICVIFNLELIFLIFFSCTLKML